MDVLRLHRPLILALGLALVVPGSAACTAVGDVTYQPPYSPVQFVLSTDGTIAVEMGREFTTSIGTFGVRGKLEKEIGDDGTAVIIARTVGGQTVSHAFEVKQTGKPTVCFDGAFHETADFDKRTLTITALDDVSEIWLVDAALGPKACSSLPRPAGTCTWVPRDGTDGGKVKDIGTPPVNAPNVGMSTLTMDTNLGAITAVVDLSKAPCTGAAVTYLASRKFWDDTKCHRLVTEGLKVLQCGDPTVTGKGWRQSDGSGGPGFRYAEENLPVNAKPAYPKGTLAMAKTSEPGSTGSQFFIVYEDADLPPDYTVLGTITEGLEIVETVAEAGSDNTIGRGDGHPKKEISIKTRTMAAT